MRRSVPSHTPTYTFSPLQYPPTVVKAYSNIPQQWWKHTPISPNSGESILQYPPTMVMAYSNIPQQWWKHTPISPNSGKGIPKAEGGDEIVVVKILQSAADGWNGRLSGVNGGGGGVKLETLKTKRYGSIFFADFGFKFLQSQLIGESGVSYYEIVMSCGDS